MRSFLLLCATSSALDITGRVVLPLPKPRSPSSADATSALAAPPEDPFSLRVVLDGGVSTVFASPADGSFSFPNVGSGVHSVEVFHADFIFSRFTVDAGGAEPVVSEFRYPGAPRLAAALPLELSPVAQAAHWEERPPSQLWGMLRNPMVIIGVAALGLM